MKQNIESLIQKAISSLQQEGILSNDLKLNIQIDRPRDSSHGDFSSNIAMVLAKQAQISPRDLAVHIQKAIPQNELISAINIAGPGFINFVLNADASFAIIKEILHQQQQFGHSDIAKGQRVNVEFVSSNPTGPLHVGHGRGAAYGSCLSNLLEAVGFDVHREYYVNDAGRQMDILTTSVWLRYLQSYGVEFLFPCNGYQGDYIHHIVELLKTKFSDGLLQTQEAVYKDVPPDQDDTEAHIDALIANAKSLLGEQYQAVLDCALDEILTGMKTDLAHFGVTFQEWFSEKSLHTSGAIARDIQKLADAGLVYEKEGAKWFKATEFGDDKDRVLVRENGQYTYFAADVAYHMEKYARGFDRIIDVFGADHHGYVMRLKAFLQALGYNVDQFDALLVQFAALYRGKEKVPMSTRKGQFVTLRDLCDEVGVDAARYFYVMRKSEQHMDFDLELAKKQSSDNPVYYIQYAHARICTVMKQLSDKGFSWDQTQALTHLTVLTNDHESALITQLSRYPETLQTAALNYQPHTLAHYLRDLANDFHTYYNAHQFLVEDAALRDARVALIQATRQVLCNGLALLGLTAPEKM